MNWKDLTEEQGRQWAGNMRSRYRAGELSPEQIAACESISPEWSWDLKVQIFLSFEQARTFVHSLGLKNCREWRAYCKTNKRPVDVPAQPKTFYADHEWKGWQDWLGTGTARKVQRTRPFEEARAFVQSLGLRSKRDWSDYCKSGKKPIDIPSNPNTAYAGKGWASMGDWLGTKTIAPQLRIFLPFEEARAFARSLGLKSMKDWQTYCKANPRADISTVPHNTYADRGWVSWGDWLGISERRTRNRKFRSFQEARIFAQTLHLKTSHEWSLYNKSDMPLDIPADPRTVYENKGWAGWNDWLGTTYLPFGEARVFVQNLGLKNSIEWWIYCKSGKPANIPAAANLIYAGKGWVSWGDWLGTGTVAYRQYKKKAKATGA
jgi:hypothetical protein